MSDDVTYEPGYGPPRVEQNEHLQETVADLAETVREAARRTAALDARIDSLPRPSEIAAAVESEVERSVREARDIIDARVGSLESDLQSLSHRLAEVSDALIPLEGLRTEIATVADESASFRDIRASLQSAFDQISGGKLPPLDMTSAGKAITEEMDSRLAEFRRLLDETANAIRSDFQMLVGAEQEASERRTDALGLRITNLAVGVQQTLDNVASQAERMAERARAIESENAAILQSIRTEITKAADTITPVETRVERPDDPRIGQLLQAVHDLSDRVVSMESIRTGLDRLASEQSVQEIVDRVASLETLRDLPERILRDLPERMPADVPQVDVAESLRSATEGLATAESVRALTERIAAFETLRDLPERLGALESLRDMPERLQALESLRDVSERLQALEALRDLPDRVATHESLIALAERLAAAKPSDALIERVASIESVNELGERLAAAEARLLDGLRQVQERATERVADPTLEDIRAQLAEMARAEPKQPAFPTDALEQLRAALDGGVDGLRDFVTKSMSEMSGRLDAIEAAVQRAVVDTSDALDGVAAQSAGGMQDVRGAVTQLGESLSGIERLRGELFQAMESLSTQLVTRTAGVKTSIGERAARLEEHIAAIPTKELIADTVADRMRAAVQAANATTDEVVAGMEQELGGVASNVNEIWIRVRAVVKGLEDERAAARKDAETIAARIEELARGEDRLAVRLIEVEQRLGESMRAIESERDRVFLETLRDLLEQLPRRERKLFRKRVRSIAFSRGEPQAAPPQPVAQRAPAPQPVQRQPEAVRPPQPRFTPVPTPEQQAQPKPKPAPRPKAAKPKPKPKPAPKAKPAPAAKAKPAPKPKQEPAPKAKDEIAPKVKEEIAPKAKEEPARAPELEATTKPKPAARAKKPEASAQSEASAVVDTHANDNEAAGEKAKPPDDVAPAKKPPSTPSEPPKQG